jgi:hypothetical protein
MTRRQRTHTMSTWARARLRTPNCATDASPRRCQGRSRTRSSASSTPPNTQAGVYSQTHRAREIEAGSSPRRHFRACARPQMPGSIACKDQQRPPPQLHPTCVTEHAERKQADAAEHASRCAPVDPGRGAPKLCYRAHKLACAGRHTDRSRARSSTVECK